MKPIFRLASSSLLIVALAACETRPTVHDPEEPAVHGTPTPTPEPTPEVFPTPTPDPNPAPLPTPAPAPVSKLPYGIPVPGKPGFVQSPFALDSGYVDVRGFPPNTEVKDPYSGKVFLVP
jgi:hypothetical protein